MAMNFWEAQRKAKSRTTLYLFFFLLMTFGIAILIEYVFRVLNQEGYTTSTMPYVGFIFLGITFLAAGYNYASYSLYGGSYVAEQVGGELIDPNTANFKEKQLLNIVHEMAVASAQPVPPVYIINSQEINAFAAGMKADNAVIAVTRGALNLLNREELQGVIGHEFGHIYNGDMKISMRLSAMIMGFFIVLYIGIRLLEGSFIFGGRGRSNGNRNGGSGNAVGLIALALILAGLITWFAGAILRSMVSRQREYLADACSVQFTRNPEGLANALRKIAKSEVHDMPKSGMAYAHLYFDNHSFWSGLFATHPPIEKRIAAIEGGTFDPGEDLTKLPPPSQ